jgi:hypothetical protein
MKVKVNNKIITIFNGAEVKDAIRKYSTKEYKKVKKGIKIITDKNGNQVMPTGELMGDEELNIIDKKN